MPDDTLEWLRLACIVIAAAIGAYFGAYLRKKGEKRAEHEEFEAIREQLAKTTRDSEEIKAALTDRTWLSQQKWAIRERHYVDLLSQLTILRLSLSDREDYFAQPGSEHNATIDDTEHFKKLRALGDAAYERLRVSVGSAAIFLSDDALKLLQCLERDYWNATESSICTADYTTQARQLVEKAQAAVLGEARRELGSIPSDAVLPPE